MEPIEFVAPWYFTTVYYALFLILSWMTVLYYMGSNQQKILHSEGSPMQGVALLLTISLALFTGLRPISRFFGDTTTYEFTYNHVELQLSPVDFNSEWLWNNLMYFCKASGLNIHEFFLVVSMGYYLGMFICSLLLARKNLWIASIFFFISFSCYSYATNGIRNGFACSLELVAIALLTEGGIKRLPAFLLMLMAFGIHRSTMLPAVAAILSAYIFKDTKHILRFWLLSIGISLVAGPMVERLFVSLGFDNRMEEYASINVTEKDMSQFSQAGFRWDFLFYSIFPVILTWYVTQYRKFKDQTFNIIANTYLLCNAFWIMVIRSAFSNRFAYLSWFIYPIVIAYPLLRMSIWKDQDRKTALILFFYTGFSFFMFFIFYFGTINGFRGLNQFWWK